MFSYSQKTNIKESEKNALTIINDSIKFKKLLAIRIYSDKAFNKSDLNDIIYKSDFNGLISVLTLNFDEGVRILKNQDISNTNYNIQELFKIALENTKKINKNNKFEKVPIQEDFAFYVSEDVNNFFINSTIFDKEKLLKLERTSGVVIAIPTRGTVLVMPIREKENFSNDIRVFYEVVNQMYLNENNPTSNALTICVKNEFYPIIPIYNKDRTVNFSIPNIW
jgi:hypothetical protein